MPMNITITKPYNIFTETEIEQGRIISIQNDNTTFDIYIGLSYRSVINEGQNNILGGAEPLHRASIVVSVDYLGQIKLLKNRWGNSFGISDDTEIKILIMDALNTVGLNEQQSFTVMCHLNRCLAEISDEPIITDRQHPLGITRRDFIRRDGMKIKRWGFKKHKMI